jgi:glycosyltransferase involved in cell wall biosynthesis
MRIAIDARAAAEVPAGRGRYVREMLRGLSRLECDHEFILYGRDRWSEGELDSRFSWRTFKAPSLAWPLLAGTRMSRSADVALACTSYAMVLPWRVPGAAVVWDFAPFDRSLKTPPGSLLERLTLPLAIRRCRALIAISNATRLELERRFPAARGRATVAHPAADPLFTPEAGAEDRQVLERHGITPPFVLVAGTLEPRKNIPRLIEAFAGLGQEREGWTLTLVGAAGWETDETFASVAAHADVVRTLGYVSDGELASLYRQADVFSYMSLYEGFGIPVLEAMQSGTAVLTSSVSSMPEVGGQAARYADPLDVQDIRRALSELLADPDLRLRCAHAGIERACAFSWDQSARLLLGVLERIAHT